jgi:hypothetical protein
MGVVDALTEWRARRWLSKLTLRLGAEGLAVAASVPGLAAAVDQHAADVRDILTQGAPADAFSQRVLLAGYGRGLLDRFDVSIDQVRNSTAGRWMAPEWLALRLLAICGLARTTGRAPARPYPGRSAAPR